jgi:cyclopropane-fatty-acyl-phospholipid synthase
MEPGMRVLDIGCGWGSFLKYAAERYGVEGVGVTVSKEQAALARAECEGLPVEILLKDYRDVEGPFDRVVSIGMFEHVGRRNYRTYCEVVRRVMKKDGLSMLHTIGRNHSGSWGRCDAWINKYIFPNGELPSIKQIADAAEGLFVLEDLHGFGPMYDKTLMAWHANFENHWTELSERYDERFRRMWRYYLLVCAASFRARRIQLWQVVLSPHGVPGGYEPVR